MTLAEIEHHLKKRFIERLVTIDVSRETLKAGAAMAIRWKRVSRKESGCFFTALDSPLEEIILDIEAELSRKERGA